MVTLDEVRARADGVYPTRVLEGCESALIVFAAAFHGAQDAIWFADVGINVTCVDLDHEKLGAMVRAYPEGWEYVHGDAYAYVHATDRRWDVVSLDPYTNQMQDCADLLWLWCLRARAAIVLGTNVVTTVTAPEGWQVTDEIVRSRYQGGTYWTVLERC